MAILERQLVRAVEHDLVLEELGTGEAFDAIMFTRRKAAPARLWPLTYGGLYLRFAELTYPRLGLASVAAGDFFRLATVEPQVPFAVAGWMSNELLHDH